MRGRGGRVVAVLSFVFLGAVACDRDSDPLRVPTKETGFLASDVVDALRTAGATVTVLGVVEQPFLSVRGSSLDVDGQRVQAFVYPDIETAEREVRAFSPDASSAGTTMITWVAPPHVYRFRSSIIIYLGSEPGTLSLLAGAFGAQVAGS